MRKTTSLMDEALTGLASSLAWELQPRSRGC